jgi:hypothetical protein
MIAAASEHRRAGMSVGAALRLARSAAARPTEAPEPESILATMREARPDLQVPAMDPQLLARISHAVARLGAGLAVTGRASDGTVESLEASIATS